MFDAFVVVVFFNGFFQQTIRCSIWTVLLAIYVGASNFIHVLLFKLYILAIQHAVYIRALFVYISTPVLVRVQAV